MNRDPPTSSPSAVVVPLSYKDILLRTSSPIPDTFPSDIVVPSPPSPVFFDPSSQSSPCVFPGNPTQSPSTPPAAALLVPSSPGVDDQCVAEPHDMSSSSATYSALFPSVPDSPLVPSPPDRGRPEVMKSVSASSPAVSVAESIGSTPASDYSVPDPSGQPIQYIDLPSGPSIPLLDHCEPSTPPRSRPPPTTSPSSSPPITPLSVSPCDSPSERMLLLGPPPPLTDTPVLPTCVRRPPPPTSTAPASSLLKKLPRGRSLVRRSCRVRDTVRS